MSTFQYQPMFEHGADETEYRHLTSEHVTVAQLSGREILEVAPEGLARLAKDAMDDMAHLLRAGHLAQLSKILDDPEASENDRFVALELLKNAAIASAPRASGLPGHRYRNCHRLQGPSRLHRRR